MKHISCLAFIICAFTVNAQQKAPNKFILDGTIDQKDGWVHLSYMSSANKPIIDSAEIKNGIFHLSGSITEPTIGFFSGKTKTRSVDDPNSTTIFLEPTQMKIVVKTNEFKQAKLTGSVSNNDFQVLQKETQKISARWKVVMDTLSAVNKRSNTKYQELRDWALVPYFQEMKEAKYAFYNSHRTSYATAYELRFGASDLTTDSLKLFYNRLPEKVQQSRLGKYVGEEVAKRKIGIPRTVAKAFIANGLSGDKVNLADEKGKYVLLDFWASWCVPCRAGNPHLKDLYAMYHTKGFDVIGVSDDDRDPAAWKKAVAQDALPWQHVLRGLKFVNGLPEKSSDINDGFNISSLPTQILIDPSGKIIGRYGDGGEEHVLLDKKLESIFSNK